MPNCAGEDRPSQRIDFRLKKTSEDGMAMGTSSARPLHHKRLVAGKITRAKTSKGNQDMVVMDEVMDRVRNY